MCIGEQHIWTYNSTDTGHQDLTGIQCDCGKMLASYEYCSKCHQIFLKPIPNPFYQVLESFQEPERYHLHIGT